MQLLYTLLCSLLLVACASSQQQSPPMFEITTTKPEDRVEFTWQDNIAYFDIHSPSGIGGARVRQTAGNVPTRSVLRVHLTGLENFKLSFAENTIEVSILSSGGLNPLEAIQRTNSTEFIPLAPTSADWVPVNIESSNPSIPLRDGFFRVELPRTFAERKPQEFSIEWIDFYR